MSTFETTPSLAVVVGRMQLPHVGHLHLIQTALQEAPFVVVVLGSAFRARDVSNPFNAGERQAMVSAMLTEAERARVAFLPVRDYFDDELWARAVVAGVTALAPAARRPVLVGAKKDASSYYLDLFPNWGFKGVEPLPELDATALRDVYFSDAPWESRAAVLAASVAPGVLTYLSLWEKLPAFKVRSAEAEVIRAYKARWTAPVNLTADALVRMGDHILVVRRGGTVGHGLWAMPGGFLNPGERFLPAALRELVEETSLGLSSAALKKALVRQVTLDHPRRSVRGRLVSEAFYFAFKEPNSGLPEVHAADDAKEAKWMPISEFLTLEESFFEDHFQAISNFLANG